MDRIELPAHDGPWSVRAFSAQDEAIQFVERIDQKQPAPFQLPEDSVGPSGWILRRGTWVVLYRPIILDA